MCRILDALVYAHDHEDEVPWAVRKALLDGYAALYSPLEDEDAWEAGERDLAFTALDLAWEVLGNHPRESVLWGTVDLT